MLASHPRGWPSPLVPHSADWVSGLRILPLYVLREFPDRRGHRSEVSLCVDENCRRWRALNFEDGNYLPGDTSTKLYLSLLRVINAENEMVLSLYSRIRYHSTYNCMNIKLHSCIFYSYLSLTHRTKKLAFLQFVNVILYNVYESRDSNTTKTWEK